MYYEDYKRQKYLVSRNTKLYRFFTSIHCEQRKMCATNKQFYIGASSLFSAIDTSLLDRFNSRTLSSRLNPISYITHLPQTNDQFLHLCFKPLIGRHALSFNPFPFILKSIFQLVQICPVLLRFFYRLFCKNKIFIILFDFLLQIKVYLHII